MQLVLVNANGVSGTTAFRQCSRIIFLAASLLTGGCASNTIEEAVPQAALGVQPAVVMQSASEPTSSPDAAKPLDISEASKQDGQVSQVAGKTADARLEQSAPIPTARPEQSGGERSAAGAKAAKSGLKSSEDGFPDLNAVPETGRKQISASEKARALSELEQARKKQGASGEAGNEEEVRRLRHLAETNGEEVLREIEGK